MKKPEELLTKEEYKNNIRKLRNELDEIFYTLIDNKKTINAYETQYVACKFENIFIKFTSYMHNIALVDDYEYKKLKKRIKRLGLVLLANFGIMFLSLPISIIIMILCGYKVYKYNNELATNYSSNDLEFEKFLQSFGIEMENCATIIDHIIKTRADRAFDDTKSIYARKFDIANNLIQVYLEKREVIEWDNIPPYIQNLAISILQDDLKTDESDIYTLINLAVENLNNLYDKDIALSTDFTRTLSNK